MAKIIVYIFFVLSAGFFTNFFTANEDLKTTIATSVFVIGFLILGMYFWYRDSKKVKKTAIQ